MRAAPALRLALVAALAACLCGMACAGVRLPPRAPFRHARNYGSRPHLVGSARSDELIGQCEQRYRDARLDHFTWSSNSTFRQRYFVCDTHWQPGGAIFYYVGNEADVTLYLNNTGLMWELAPRHNALLVFAEHRYYGESKPFPDDVLRDNMAYLTSEQAMADYAQLIWELREELGDPVVPVIGFGGSYGGMLAAWFRLKYPHLMDGAIAGSAPIWTYYGEDPPYDTGSFAAIVTRDATSAAGAAPQCAPNARVRAAAAFPLSVAPAPHPPTNLHSFFSLSLDNRLRGRRFLSGAQLRTAGTASPLPWVFAPPPRPLTRFKHSQSGRKTPGTTLPWATTPTPLPTF